MIYRVKQSLVVAKLTIILTQLCSIKDLATPESGTAKLNPLFKCNVWFYKGFVCVCEYFQSRLVN